MPIKILRRITTETKLDSGGAVVRLAVDLPVRCQCGAALRPSDAGHNVGAAHYFNVECAACSAGFTVQLNFN